MSTYYHDEGCTLSQGDCLDLLPLVADRSVDAVICDPPYGTTACAWDSVIPFAPMWAELKRIIKPKGAMMLFGSQPFTSALVMSNPTWFRYQWVWRKNLKVGHLNARQRPMVGHEDIIVFSKTWSTYNPQQTRRTTQVKAGNKYNGGTTVYGTLREAYLDRQSDWLMPDTVLDFDCVHSSHGRKHPSQKPVALLEYLVKTYTNPGETVLDFCFGSGTTAVACKKLGRRFIGMEQEEAYCRIVVERLCPPIAQEVLL